MKKWWAVQAARIDGLSLRERVFLFLSIVLCAVALAEVMWLSPARTEYAQINQRFTRQNAELQRLRDELKAMPTPMDPGAAVSTELALIGARLADTDQSIRELSKGPRTGAPMEQVLSEFLRRHDNLMLVRMATLPPQAGPSAVAAGAAGAQGSGGATLAVAGVSRQGIELTVEGPYADLIRMVRSLERELPALRWGQLHLAAQKLPPQLTLQVFVVSALP